jgi:hypothetical protein
MLNKDGETRCFLSSYVIVILPAVQVIHLAHQSGASALVELVSVRGSPDTTHRAHFRRGYRRPGFAAAAYGAPLPRDNRVDRFGREWVPETTRRPPSTSDELPPVDWKSLAELPSPREGTGGRELAPREIGAPGPVAREGGAGFRDGLGPQEGGLVAREGFGARDGSVTTPARDPLYTPREGVNARDGFGVRDSGPLSAREPLYGAREAGASFKEGPYTSRDRLGPSPWRTGGALAPGGPLGKGGLRDRDDLPPRREGYAERSDYNDRPGFVDRRVEDRPALFERLAERPGRALERLDRTPGMYISPPPHPEYPPDKQTLDNVSPRGLGTAKISPRGDNRPSPRSFEAGVSPRRLSEKASPRDAPPPEKAFSALPKVTTPLPAVTPVVASVTPFSSASPLEPSMSGQSSDQRGGERPRPRLGWGQGLVAFERVKPKEEEEQVSSARRPSGTDAGMDSVGASPAVSEDKSASQRGLPAEPGSGVVESRAEDGLPKTEGESQPTTRPPSPSMETDKVADVPLSSEPPEAAPLESGEVETKEESSQVPVAEPPPTSVKVDSSTPKASKVSAWPQSLSALTEKEGTGKVTEATKEGPARSAEGVSLGTEVNPPPKVSPWPQSLSAAMGLLSTPEGLPPIKTPREGDQPAVRYDALAHHAASLEQDTFSNVKEMK